MNLATRPPASWGSSIAATSSSTVSGTWHGAQPVPFRFFGEGVWRGQHRIVHIDLRARPADCAPTGAAERGRARTGARHAAPDNAIDTLSALAELIHVGGTPAAAIPMCGPTTAGGRPRSRPTPWARRYWNGPAAPVSPAGRCDATLPGACSRASNSVTTGTRTARRCTGPPGWRRRSRWPAGAGANDVRNSLVRRRHDVSDRSLPAPAPQLMPRHD